MKTILLLLIAVITATCNNLSPKVRYENLIAEANNLVLSKQYAKAIAVVGSAIKIDSLRPYGYVLRGKIRYEMKLYKEALEDFSKALAIQPQNTSAYFSKGWTFYELEEFDSALICFNAALASKKAGNSTIEIVYNPVMGIDSDYDIPAVEIRYARGINLLDKNGYAAALEDFEYCRMKNYRSADTEFYLGLTLLGLKRQTEACAHFKVAVLAGDEEARDYYSEYCN